MKKALSSLLASYFPKDWSIWQQEGLICRAYIMSKKIKNLNCHFNDNPICGEDPNET
jgi:hypothetical protein